MSCIEIGEVVRVVDAEVAYTSYTDFMDKYGDEEDKALFNPFRDIYKNDTGVVKCIHCHLTEPCRMPLAIVNNGNISFIIGVDGLASIDKFISYEEAQRHSISRFVNSEEITDVIYPLTIVKDRYNGTYSGGKFIAWSLYPESINPDSSGDDLECSLFWETNEVPCGKGSTIEEAVADLYFKMKRGKII